MEKLRRLSELIWKYLCGTKWHI